MDPNAHRSRGRNDEADAYGRRRFFALVAGLGVIGLLAWACSGVASGGGSSRGAGVSGHASSAAYGSAAGGQQAGGAAVPALSPSAQPTVSVSLPSPSPPISVSPVQRSSAPSTPAASSAAPAGHSHPAKAAAGTGTGACPAADIVLTLLASKASYAPNETPTFQIDIVSTDVAACTIDLGPEALRVVIMHGNQQAWNSGACLNGATSHVSDLRRGVPVVMSMAWNRHLTKPGCPMTIVAATHRTYVAVAQGGGAQSPAQSFKLR